MTGTAEDRRGGPIADADDAERLRRRLYRPGARGEDVAAYRSVLADGMPLAEPAPEMPPHPRRRTPPALLLPLLAVALTTAVLLLAGGLPGGSVRAGSGPAPTPLPTAEVDEATRSAFVARLREGCDAGLAAWWGRSTRSVEEHGVGPATVPLPPSASGSGGRLTVLLVVDTGAGASADAAAGWAAARLVIHDDRTIHLRTMTSASGGVRAGVPVVGRLDFTANARPLRLLVRVPEGVRWGVAGVFSREGE